MTWLQALLLQLLSPAWVAGLIQATSGALIAFVGAFLLFRRQLKHDREIAQQQVEADRAARYADRRAHAADLLGRTMIEVARDLPLEDSDDRQTIAAVTDIFALAPGAQALKVAIEESELVLSRSEKLWSLHREVEARWYGVRRMANGLTPQQLMQPYALANVYAEVMLPVASDLDAVGRALVRWDGHGSSPLDEASADNRSFLVDEQVDQAAHYQWKVELDDDLTRRRLERWGA